MLAALPIGTPALASSFQVNPVVIEIVPDRHSATVTVHNSESDPVSIRVRLYRWTQHDGQDDYADTSELIASPPIFTLAGNGTQLLRVGPRSQPLSGAYRIILEEIPTPSGQVGKIKISLRLNLPLYVMPDRAAKADLRWTGWRDAAGDLMLEAQNAGARYGSVVQIRAAGASTALTSSPGSVLPGGSKRWNLGKHPEIGAAPLQLDIRASSGEITHSQIVVGRR
ncbi:MAG: hypothetical protein JWN66_4341 [Sphingomonas bacterium]|nr:hypothetical protein [Sphingomonas bacterium]